MSTREAYQEKQDAQLRQWDAQIAKLRARADQAKAEAKIQYLEQIEELRNKRESAGKKLEELKKAGDGAYEDVKTGVEKAWKDLGSALESAVSKFS